MTHRRAGGTRGAAARWGVVLLAVAATAACAGEAIDDSTGGGALPPKTAGAADAVITPGSPAPTALSGGSRAASSSADELAAERELLSLHNQARADAGLAPLRVYWDLVDDARAHTAAQQQDGHIYHNDALAQVTATQWLRLGENVGVGGSMRTLHDAFMASPGHRANVLGDFNYVGIGVLADGARRWVTVVFLKSPSDTLDRALPPFVDDEGTTHEAAILKIYNAGITTGCAGPPHRRYCPKDNVTRGQMAAFLVRAFKLPKVSKDYFTDDSGRFYEAAANALAAARLTVGCNPAGTRYCGEDPVTRGQMAVFLDRALSWPKTSVDYFQDDGGRFYEGAANRMRAAGVTVGCNAAGTHYCGEQPVTREQMASFLARALGL